MNTSRRVSWPEKNQVLTAVAVHPAYSRYVAAALFCLATVSCVFALGWGSGIFAAIVILMTAGSVTVLFFPFHYLGVKGIAVVYVCALVLELLIH
ncbi:MAG TPA: hypothetical protein VGN64_01935 [Dyadobacter sp.]|jgi:hypothetical protein|nr:hypothetical protein [Dyadobacter sp.]